MKLLTVVRDLQRRKARERQQRFIAEGVRTVEALLASPLSIVGIIATDLLGVDERGARLLATAHHRRIDVRMVTEVELLDAADTETPQGVIAVAEIPKRSLSDPPSVARYLVLDALQDPGNVGTVVRTAAALGVTATIALPGTVDLWNAKVVRSAMGALFVHPVLALSWEQSRAFFDAHAIPLWAADSDGVAIDTAVATIPERLALVVSNEGAGLSEQVAQSSIQRVAIRMSPDVESLNVAVATGILLHAIRPSS